MDTTDYNLFICKIFVLILKITFDENQRSKKALLMSTIEKKPVTELLSSVIKNYGISYFINFVYSFGNVFSINTTKKI